MEGPNFLTARLNSRHDLIIPMSEALGQASGQYLQNASKELDFRS